MASNFPIPRQEDIKAKLTGKKIFSKLDLKSAFWQLEIATEARNLTTFHANGKLYRYKRLIMGLKPSQGGIEYNPYSHICLMSMLYMMIF